MLGFCVKISETVNSSDYLKHHYHRVITHGHIEARKIKVSDMHAPMLGFCVKSSETVNSSDYLKHHYHHVITHGHTKAIDARKIVLEGFSVLHCLQ